ncbi:MAG: VIT and VWA domain-containing protein [Planctomycetales bacterium]|nr:VIT and VWA domain-containing protein [Planctomycetales bacterium]
MVKNAVLGLALVAASAGAARADGLITIRRPPEPGPVPTPLAVVYHRVQVSVRDQTATTKIDQVFRNPNNRVLEGTYIFPLPEDSAISEFVLYVDGKPQKGELLDRDRARRIYEDIVRSQKDPALLEYVGRDAFQANVFPIPARGDTRIELSYSQLLRHDAGLTAYRYPLNTEKFSSKPLEEVSIVVDLATTRPLANVYSPSHEVDVARRSDREARVSFERRNVRPDRDFFLYFGTTAEGPGLSVASHRRPGEDGTFLLLVMPNQEAAAPVAKDVVFVVDTSGSMAENRKMAQAQRALRQCLGRLRPQDRFGIVAFATDARPFREALAPADEATLREADRFVAALEARGGTAIEESLASALRMVADGGSRPAYVVFMTDGQPTIGERDPDRLLARVREQVRPHVRVFVLGVGEDLNTTLLDRLADDHRGAREYVTGAEEVEGKISAFYDKIAFPVLTDLRLEVVGLETSDVYPRRLPDLFRGQQLAVLGRYRGPVGEGGARAVRLTGNVGGTARTYVVEGNFGGASVGADLLPRLWAVRKIGYLMEEIRLRGETPEVKGEVVRLSKQYGVMTPYTSYLVVEEGARPQVGLDGRTRGGPTAPTGPGGDAWRRFADGAASAPATGAPVPAEAARELRSSGAGGIRAGEALDKLKEAKAEALEEMEKDERIRAVARTVGTKTFYKQGDAWVDSEWKAGLEEKSVTAFSDEYLALVAATPELGQYFALGERLTVVHGGKAYKVVPA